MKPEIPLDHVDGYLIPKHARNISILPTLLTPQLLVYLEKSRQSLLSTDRPQQLHHLPSQVLRRKTQKHMRMVFVHFQLFHLKPMMLRYCQKQFPYALPHRFLQHPLAMLGSPRQMTAGSVATMGGMPNWHTPTLQDRCCLRQTPFSSPPHAGRGIQRRFLVRVCAATNSGRHPFVPGVPGYRVESTARRISFATFCMRLRVGRQTMSPR